MQEGTVVKWLKKEGDLVVEGEPLAEIETTKIDSELEAPLAGVLKYIVVPEGDTVPVSTLLCVIAAPGEEVSRPPPAAAPSPAAAGAPAGARPVRPPAARVPAASRQPGAAVPARAPAGSAVGAPAEVVPAARRLAQQHGLDLAQVRGSGPRGRINEADVLQAIEVRVRPVVTQPSPGVVPLSRIRRTIAERMTMSLRAMAQVTLTSESDVTEAVDLRRELVGLWRPHRLRPVDQDLVIKATARALREHPEMNATVEGEGIRRWGQVNIGVATALQDGLVVAVVRDADEKDLLAIAREVRELAAKAREGHLSVDEVTGSTFTISTLAGFDVDAFTPIINPPEVGILGVGRVQEKPAVFKGEIAKRSLMVLSLTFDHRAVDGAPAAQFLQSVKRYLEEPRWMLA